MNTSCLDIVVHDQDCLNALHELEIDPDDHKNLADILDPDHNGAVGVLDLVQGLRKLRGEPRRSDIVTVDLMVRALQEKVHDAVRSINKVRKEQELNMKRQEGWHEACMHELKS